VDRLANDAIKRTPSAETRVLPGLHKNLKELMAAASAECEVSDFT
jgi:hypothetical protein